MRKPGEKTAAEMRAALSGIRCFLLDMDGTFYLGDRIIEGSMEFLQKVEQTGRSYLFLTNNSSRSVQHYVEKLGRLGLHVGEDKILTSGQAAAQYLKREYPGKRVFLLGNPSLREEMEKHGIALEDEHPDLVLVGFDTTLDYAKMTRVCDLVREGLPYIATHPDFNCPTESGFIPDIGAIMAFIEASTERKADVIIGKPCGEIVRAAQERTGLAPGEMAMVGDRLYTDIALGRNNGLTSILVLTGETKREDVNDANAPDFIFENIGEIAAFF